MKPLISVIVPVYNAEQYLKFCVDGLIRQTYENLEIILVDDGSTDHSGKMCDAYAAEDSRVSVIHKKNGGQSEARNFGLDQASGEFIAFADSDDEVSEDYISYLYQLITDCDADISVCRYRYVHRLGTVFADSGEEIVRQYDAKEAVEALCYQHDFSFATYCMLTKRELFEGIRFPVGMIYEEMDVIPSLFFRAQKIVYGNGVKYHYLQRTGSTVRAEFSPQKMDYVKNTWKMMEHIVQQTPDLEPAARSRFLWANLHVYVQMTDRKSVLYQEVSANIKKYRWSVLRDSKVRLENKLLLVLSIGGNQLIRAMYQMRGMLAH